MVRNITGTDIGQLHETAELLDGNLDNGIALAAPLLLLVLLFEADDKVDGVVGQGIDSLDRRKPDGRKVPRQFREAEFLYGLFLGIVQFLLRKKVDMLFLQLVEHILNGFFEGLGVLGVKPSDGL